MMNLSQIKGLVIRPSLASIGLDTDARVNIVTGIGLTESGYRVLEQSGGGPALGPWQMERATHDDLTGRYLSSTPAHAALGALVARLTAPGMDRFGQLAGNLYYGAAMCAVKLLPAPASLPDADDAAGMCAYWKQWYNTAGGKGAVTQDRITLFEQAIRA